MRMENNDILRRFRDIESKDQIKSGKSEIKKKPLREKSTIE
jgi:hypothetical protein